MWCFLTPFQAFNIFIADLRAQKKSLKPPERKSRSCCAWLLNMKALSHRNSEFVAAFRGSEGERRFLHLHLIFKEAAEVFCRLEVISPTEHVHSTCTAPVAKEIFALWNWLTYLCTASLYRGGGGSLAPSRPKKKNGKATLLDPIIKQPWLLLVLLQIFSIPALLLLLTGARNYVVINQKAS